MTKDSTAGLFKTCGCCKSEWPTWDHFVLDPAVRLLGLQAVASFPDANLLVFEHRCRSSVSVLTKRLRHLLPPPGPDGPTERLLGTEQCRGHCSFLGDMEMCDAPCRNARDRELILLVQRMKNGAEEPADR
jgi:hypothetical protein